MTSEKRPEDASEAPAKTALSSSLERDEPSPAAAADDDDDSQDALAALSQSERDIITRQINVEQSDVSYLTLYRFATKFDMAVLAGSSIAAIAGGTALPLMTVVFGNLTGTFSKFSQGSFDASAGSAAINSQSLYMVYIGIGEFFTIYLAIIGFIYAGQRITQKTRQEYLRAIMRQNIAYFDTVGAGEITKRITTDTALLQDGISEKVALTIIAISIFVTAFVVGFVKSWALTLVMTSTVATVLLLGGVSAFFMIRYSKQSLQAYSGGGTISQEVFASIRIATAFGIQSKLAAKFCSHLELARKWEVKKKIAVAIMIAGIQWVANANDGLAYWQGARFLVVGRADVSAIVAIAANILIGALSLGAVGPYVETFSTAVAAGTKIYSTIDRKSPLDPLSESGQRPAEIRGEIELRNIRHIYPSRPEVVALNDVSLHIPSGRTTALVGASGSGKSTIVGLLERFYDPVGGELFLDGINVRDINLRHLRQQMALVSQEPTLFNTTIEANIAYGLSGSVSEDVSPEKRRQLVVDAAKMANAHDFISRLPQQYETNVGESGSLMSGGQKQRIAIARAVIGDPKILILDEATSALDTTSESVVQAALDKAAQGRTTIVVAHRLSTIRNADNIVVMDHGSIVEQGRHDELLEKKGAYHVLVEAQQVAARTKKAMSVAEQSEADDDPIEKAGSMELNGLSITTGDKPIQHNTTGTSKGEPIVQLVRTRTNTSNHSAEEKQAEDKRSYSAWQSIKFIASFNREEKGIVLLGLLASIVAGCCYPVSVIFLAKCITALFLPQSQYDELLGEISFWAAMFFMLAWVNLISMAAQGVIFAYCSERLIYRARDRAFRTMLRQDVGFYDIAKNTSGALTSFLFTETTYLAGLSGATLGTILTFACTLLASLALGIGIGWKLGLVYTSVVPILFAAGFFRLWMLARFETRCTKENEESASQACEATAAIRTVASLTLEMEVCDTYGKQLNEYRHKALASVAKTSTLYAFSQSALLWCMALGFWYGGTLIVSGQYDTLQLFICLAAIIIGAQGSGVIFSFAPDMGKAKHAAEALQALFDRQPKIDIWSTTGKHVETIKGEVELQNVRFHYPTRPEQPILRGLDLSVKPGQFVALVGTSGCGKSTIVQLLERFYDPISGSVLVDGNDISQLRVSDYRRFLAVVSQEPALYEGTIKENIMLGAVGEESEVTEEMITQACKDANIYDFIISLPDGFNTLVGAKGSMLSGGQKQRVAIARALIRNPRILLLDEATSALDSTSERVVQAALDQAARGRTTIAIAHRLSTIQHADVIYVIDRGLVAEKGTHQELLRKEGQYAELVKLQNLEQRSAN